jgi:hypothetical protein
MFKQICYEKLVVGEKYKIKTACHEFTGIYTGPNSVALIFSNVKYNHFYGSIAFSRHDSYYKFVSKNPQEKMERRALNIILRSLLGDYFEW